MLRFRGRTRTTLTVVLPAALLAVGLFVGSLRSAEWAWRTPLLSEVGELTSLAPVRALPRTEAVLATLEAQRFLDADRPYAAWESLRDHTDVEGPAGQAASLVAARAAAAWGGWPEVRSVLSGRDWLGEVAGGEGYLLLGRAEEELGGTSAAINAYRAYLAVETARDRGSAHVRLGSLLGERGEHLAAAEHFEAAASVVPEIADWLRVLQVEHLVLAGDPSATSVATGLSGGSAPVRLRRVQLEAQGWVTAAETNRAIRRLEWEARVLNAEGARLEAAQLELERARLLLGSTSPAAGREILQRVASNNDLPSSVRLSAAERLGELQDRTVADELARAAGYEAGSRPGLAARSLRAAFDSGLRESAAERLRLAHLLYAARDYAPARAAFQRAAELLQDPEQKADATLHAARSLFRRGGSSARQSALSEMRRLAETYPGTAAAGTALFLLGDEAATNQAGLGYYRRAAEVRHSPDARESLFRVGDRSLRIRDTAGAIRAWEEYVARYPLGEQTARVAYEVGRLHASAGRRAASETMFTAAIMAEPTSYWALRAGERLDVHPLDHVLAEPTPWVGLASEPGEAADALRRLDRLDALGLDEQWEAEYRAILRTFENKPLAALVFAEGLRDRNLPVHAINLGRQLLSQREGRWDERLLRVVFPFPYRDLIVAEARREGVDPYLYAGLVRQESSFRADARSWVGATGLGQIMPATGSWLASGVGIRNYRQALLEVPEVNLRMGTKYLGDLLRRYDGAVDLALAGYNAGPSRADRWRRQFNYGSDTDAFRAAIPFDETRNYVMIVLRNASIYNRLYAPTDLPASMFAD